MNASDDTLDALNSVLKTPTPKGVPGQASGTSDTQEAAPTSSSDDTLNAINMAISGKLTPPPQPSRDRTGLIAGELDNGSNASGHPAKRASSATGSSIAATANSTATVGLFDCA